MPTAHEHDLRAAKEDLDAARSAFVRAIIRARAAGMSLRQIAAAAGVSHESVRRLTDDGARDQ
jgi:AcrR family transcriptional regulator